MKLPIKYCYLSIGDVIEFQTENNNHILRIIDIGQGNNIRIQAVPYIKQTLYGWANEELYINNYRTNNIINIPSLLFAVVDIPNINGIGGITIAVCLKSKN